MGMRSAEKTQADKVCDVCGVVGFAKEIVTCCRCKRTTEHTYCMEKQLDYVPQEWFCEGCEDSTPMKSMKRKIIEISCVDVKKNKTPVKRSTSWTNRGSRRGTNGKKKWLPAPCTPSSMLDITSKMPDINVGSLPGPKRTFDIEQRLASELARRNQAKLVHSPITQVAFTNISKVAGLKSSKALNFSEDKTTSNKEQVTPVALATENGAFNKEGHFQIDEVSGKEASESICKKEPLELHQASLGNTTMHGEPKSNFPSSLPASDKQTGVILEAVGPIKRETVELCCNSEVQDFSLINVGFKKSKCRADVMLFHAHELESNLETDDIVGKNSLNRHLDTKGFGGFHGVTSGSILPADSSGNTLSSVSKSANSGFQKKDRPFTLLVISEDKILAPQPCWKGVFEVQDRGFHIYHGIQAHLPSKVSLKAFEYSKQFPKNLIFKLLHRLEVWPQVFRLDPPLVEDIGVYFFPCEQQRSKERYTYLIEGMNRRDLAMQGCLGDVEILLFTSKQLPETTQSTGITMEVFIWGVFRRFKRSKKCLYEGKQCPGQIHAASNDSAHSRPDNPVKIKPELSILGGEVNGRLGGPTDILDVPPGFSRRKSRNINCQMRSLAENACWTSSSMPDIPPGFSAPFTPKSSLADADMGPALSRRNKQCHESLVSRGGYAQMQQMRSLADNARNTHCQMSYLAENACLTSSSMPDIPPGFSAPFTPKSSSAEMDLGQAPSRKDRQWHESLVSSGGYDPHAVQSNYPQAAKPLHQRRHL